MGTPTDGDKRIGNSFWKLRAKHGRDKIFSTPAILWECAKEYFESVEDNPDTEVKAMVVDKCIEKVETPIVRPFLMSGLCIYLGVTESYFRNFKAAIVAKGNNATQIEKDFLTLVEYIELVIYQQKVNGAITGVFNSRMIGNLIGLTDKQEIKQISVNVEPTSEEAKRIKDSWNDKI